MSKDIENKKEQPKKKVEESKKQENQKQNNQKKPFSKPDLKDLKKPKGVNWLYLSIFLFLGFMLFQNSNPKKDIHDISLSKFESLLQNKEIDSIIIFDQKRLATAFLNKQAAEKTPCPTTKRHRDSKSSTTS